MPFPIPYGPHPLPLPQKNSQTILNNTISLEERYARSGVPARYLPVDKALQLSMDSLWRLLPAQGASAC
jgi:hypothetical protein